MGTILSLIISRNSQKSISPLSSSSWSLIIFRHSFLEVRSPIAFIAPYSSSSSIAPEWSISNRSNAYFKLIIYSSVNSYYSFVIVLLLSIPPNDTFGFAPPLSADFSFTFSAQNDFFMLALSLKNFWMEDPCFMLDSIRSIRRIFALLRASSAMFLRRPPTENWRTFLPDFSLPFFPGRFVRHLAILNLNLFYAILSS